MHSSASRVLPIGPNNRSDLSSWKIRVRWKSKVSKLLERNVSKQSRYINVRQLPRRVGQFRQRFDRLQCRTTGVVHVKRHSNRLPTRVHLCRCQCITNALSKRYVHQQHGFRLLHSLFTGQDVQQRRKYQMRRMSHGVFTTCTGTINMYSSRSRINRGQRRIFLGRRTTWV